MKILLSFIEQCEARNYAGSLTFIILLNPFNSGTRKLPLPATFYRLGNLNPANLGICPRIYT